LIMFMRNDDSNLSTSKSRKLLGIVLISFGALLLFSMLLLRVWLSSKTVELAYEIGQLEVEKKTLEEENKKLSIQVAKLKSPERISRIAITDLKMIRSSDTEVVILER